MPCQDCTDFQITLLFNRASQAGNFLSDLENWSNWKRSQPASAPTATTEPRVDRRGSHTKELHRRARDYQVQNPLVSYHECMRLCKNTI